MGTKQKNGCGKKWYIKKTWGICNIGSPKMSKFTNYNYQYNSLNYQNLLLFLKIPAIIIILQGK